MICRISDTFYRVENDRILPIEDYVRNYAKYIKLKIISSG